MTHVGPKEDGQVPTDLACGRARCAKHAAGFYVPAHGHLAASQEADILAEEFYRVSNLYQAQLKNYTFEVSDRTRGLITWPFSEGLRPSPSHKVWVWDRLAKDGCFMFLGHPFFGVSEGHQKDIASILRPPIR